MQNVFSGGDLRLLLELRVLHLGLKRTYTFLINIFFSCKKNIFNFSKTLASVVDPEPDVFGPPGAVSVSPDADPAPSIIRQNSKKNLNSYCFVSSSLLIIFEK